MKELIALLPGKLTWPIREDAINFLPTYCFGALTLTISYPDDAATYNNCRIGSVVDMIVFYNIAPIDVLSARTISCQQKACSTNMLNMAIAYAVILTVQIHPYCGSAAMEKSTSIERAILRVGEPDISLFT